MASSWGASCSAFWNMFWSLRSLESGFQINFSIATIAEINQSSIPAIAIAAIAAIVAVVFPLLRSLRSLSSFFSDRRRRSQPTHAPTHAPSLPGRDELPWFCWLHGQWSPFLCAALEEKCAFFSLMITYIAKGIKTSKFKNPGIIPALFGLIIEQ